MSIAIKCSWIFEREKNMKKVSLILALGFTALIVSACGDNKSSTPATAAANSCAAGSGFSAQYNSCLPQSYCQVGQGLYNNQCVPVTTTAAPTTAYNYNNGYNTYNPTTPANSCPVGQGFSTQYNTCLAQGACPAGQGAYTINNTTTCVAVTINTGYNTGYNTGTNYYNNGGYNTGNNGGCGPNMAYTVVGCLAQGPCNYGQVFYNNQCYNLVQNQGAGFGFQFRIGRIR